MQLPSSDTSPDVAREPGPARHERPAIDEAALVLARDADLALAELLADGIDRWARFFEGYPDRLRDASVAELRGVAMKMRSAFGPKDSIRDALPPALTEPMLTHIDRLLKLLARDERG
jgi:hypothetical protein